jgi:hypothetical protein
MLTSSFHFFLSHFFVISQIINERLRVMRNKFKKHPYITSSKYTS